MKLNDLTAIIIETAIEVHKELGPGLYKYVYEQCVAHELKQLGLKVKYKMESDLKYKSLTLENAFCVDLMVNDTIAVEFKFIGHSEELHISKLLTYMKFTNSKTGLLLNFNNERLVYSIKRLENRLNS